ncbi:MAG: hypothetical protein PVF58_16965 [Candidatus Methanofastidiosia archaeon]|jgi:hypothetical protein
MRKKTVLVLVMAFAAFSIATTSVAHCLCGPPPSPPVPSVPNPNSMMGPAANNVIGKALELKEKANSLFDQAEEQDLDVTEFEDILEKADALLEKAQKIARVNPIPAGNMAREASELYNQLISDLEALLG